MRFYKANASLPTANAIDELEDQIGYLLPADYRDFLIQYNGGQPERQILYVPDCRSETMIHQFLGISVPHADIEEWLEELNDDLKDAFLPIGFDPGGNALLMNKSDGKIYYWDSARHFPCSSDEENAYWVADSFNDLLEKLR